MIRFSCTSCGREYQLPDALARMPLLCKGCGRRLDVPEPTPEPFPDSPPGHPFLSQAMPGTVDLFPEADVPRKRSPTSTDALSPQDTVDLFPRPVLEPTPAGVVPETPAATPPAPAADPRGRAVVFFADVAVGLVLAGVGALLGEFAAGRSTAEILREAGGAPKFPTMNLLLWLGCVASPVLGYVLFANRGKSLGGWLRRRAGG